MEDKPGLTSIPPRPLDQVLSITMPEFKAVLSRPATHQLQVLESGDIQISLKS